MAEQIRSRRTYLCSLSPNGGPHAMNSSNCSCSLSSWRERSSCVTVDGVDAKEEKSGTQKLGMVWLSVESPWISAQPGRINQLGRPLMAEAATSPIVKSSVRPANETQSAWLNAWYDPVASIRATSSCIAFSDVGSDGDSKLVLADYDQRLRAYKGTGIMSEAVLLDPPVGVINYYMDNTGKPAVAVAAGPSIYLYKAMRPYYKFSLPLVVPDDREQEVWFRLMDASGDYNEAASELLALRDGGMKLTPYSNEFIAKTEQTHRTKLLDLTVITCISSIYKSRQEETAVSCLIIGAENSTVYVLHPSASSVLKKFQLPSEPVTITASGIFDVDHKIHVATRSGVIYIIQNGAIAKNRIDLESHLVGMVDLEKSLVVGCVDRTIHAYALYEKTYSIYVQHNIITMAPLVLISSGAKCIMVALENHDVNIYNDKNLVCVIPMNDRVIGIRFGRFSRESNSLVLVMSNGGIACKILSRSANLTATIKAAATEVDVPLQIPKKNKLYLEQAEREKMHSAEMHRIFQRELHKLRLTTAKAYINVVTDTESGVTFSQGSLIRLSAQVAGVGPTFKLKTTVENTGKKTLSNLPMTFSFDPSIYNVSRPVLILPMLVPGLSYQQEVRVQCLSDNGVSDDIRIFVIDPQRPSLPIVSCLLHMPVSELFFDA
ncbi:bardet-Biedl syndrome 1 family protein [Planoprotostelium fungivorum]|uniref:Bardet-Biedl syndrome 1 family protein n=1 Tax=Planoprotostelium fungivorum TaxID=1890364 RepID=A0A2P6NGJ6_9EUKA|nr:bardet-Biedl syndrome 1 family protein [Planoprotostelium fungivorum]